MEFGRWYDNGDGTVTRYNEDGTSETRDRNDPEVVNAAWDDQRAREDAADRGREAGDRRREEGDWGENRRAREAADAAYNDSRTNDEGWSPFEARSSPGSHGDEGTGGAGGGGGGGGGGGVGNTWNDWAAGVPILDWLTGEEQDQANAAADAERARHEGYWGSLVNDMPTEDELSVEYGNEGLVRDTTAEGALARSNWRDWAEGGFTDSDRAMMDESRRRAGMTARADREASLSALEARGMGGSGASLAASLSAGEGAADRGASMDAAMMGAVQQRQIGATGALADWASGETDYERGREGRNTDRENRTRESAAEAAQGAYENRERLVSGLDNQYGGGRREDDDSDEAAAGFLGGLFDEVF